MVLFLHAVFVLLPALSKLCGFKGTVCSEIRMNFRKKVEIHQLIQFGDDSLKHIVLYFINTQMSKYYMILHKNHLISNDN